MTDKTPTPTFEESLSELEAIVNEMENGDLPLHTALEKFERGIKLSRQSQQSLEQAEQKVKILLSEQGQETLTPLKQDDNN
ncbi:exodeoxyribonuclease VII small subunit [Alteromonas sp. ASW11-19]|uniref:Exodeoxyribonuclease 7 small subunit n=1 Tax=Alteromonas salexigens TaxID=2982530 RepID=A0ABT2VR43_9ALTE|nr:exodeoxyribonuclease VII small subunit [Alteromonas salexigens]MCU7555769.1 exodeoxyribonuclease VII small subunit [Alteromonas salexigens]